jgi:serine/threonine protein kinase/Tfp pilus assembly protein PilF
MLCPKCHFDNTEDSSYCKKCGTRIHSEEGTASAATLTGTLPSSSGVLAPGSTFAGRYQVFEEIGKGGMGRVYRVLDKEIDEKIALKILNPEIAADTQTIERFRNELKTARQISHKNVCRMYHFGKDEGVDYITMEYVRGEDLKSMIRMMGRLSPGQAVSIARQVGEGLAEAHRLGVVHRDLKPQNIMIDRDGHVKIMDFGIARTIKTEGITGPGMMVGTPEYMSPEQAEGKDVDERSDIYGLGIILFEMLTGKVPFEADSPLGIALKQKTEMPPDPRKINPQIPENLGRLILRCLAKEKGRRYQNAQELVHDLGEISKNIPDAKKYVPQRKPRTATLTMTISQKKWRTIAVTVLVTLAAIIAVLYLRPGRPAPAAGGKRLAVLPFENLGPPEDEYFADAITDEITARLGNIAQLGVIGRASAINYKKTNKNVHQIGEELGVDYILSGTIRWQRQPGSVNKVRVTPALIKASDGRQVWAAVYDEEMAEVLGVQSQIAKRVAESLNIALLEPAQKALEAKPTNNPEAYDYYLRGHDYFNRGAGTESNLTISIEMFERAIALDPRFVHAYGGLARGHAMMYWYHFDRTPARVAKAKEAMDKAIELGPDLPETHFALGVYYYYCHLEYDKALEQLNLAREKQPKNSEILETIGYIKRRQGKMNETVTILTDALEINPRSLEIMYNLADTYYLLRRYVEAESMYRRGISFNPDYVRLYLGSSGGMANLYFSWRGDTVKDRELLEEISKKSLSSGDQIIFNYYNAIVNIFDGKLDQALQYLSLMSAEALDNQFYFVSKARLYAQVYGLKKDKAKEREYYSLDRVDLEKRIRERPDDPRFHSALAIACAGLGLKEKAVEEAKIGMQLLPVSKEFWRGTFRVKDLAQVYVMVGEYDKAFDQIEYLLSIPGELSVPLLKLDPVWAPLRSLPRFQELSVKYKTS